jgi:hypothetical protein
MQPLTFDIELTEHAANIVKDDVKKLLTFKTDVLAVVIIIIIY